MTVQNLEHALQELERGCPSRPFEGSIRPLLKVEVTLTPAMAGGPKHGQGAVRVVRNGQPDAYSNKGFMPLAQAKRLAAEEFAYAKEEVAADKVRFATQTSALAAWEDEIYAWGGTKRELEMALERAIWAEEEAKREARRRAISQETRSDRWENAQLNPYTYQGD